MGAESFPDHEAEPSSVEQQINQSFETFADVLRFSRLRARLDNFAAAVETWPDGVPSFTPELEKTLDEVAGRAVAARAARGDAIVFDVTTGYRSRNERYEGYLDALVISGSAVPPDLFSARSGGLASLVGKPTMPENPQDFPDWLVANRGSEPEPPADLIRRERRQWIEDNDPRPFYPVSDTVLAVAPEVVADMAAASNGGFEVRRVTFDKVGEVIALDNKGMQFPNPDADPGVVEELTDAAATLRALTT